MKYSHWIGLAAALLMAIGCYQPWVSIPTLSHTISGMDGAGTTFGKPGKLHLIFAGITAVFFLIPRVWAKRCNLLFCAMNTAWAVRNFLLYARCEMGTCPERELGLYLVLLGSVVMLAAALFPDMKVKK